MEPSEPRREKTSTLHRGRRLTAAAAAMLISISGAQSSADVSAAAELLSSSPASGIYLYDLELALRLRSPETEELAAAVERSRLLLAAARRGLSAVGTLSPNAEYERDLATTNAEWEVELELELVGVYRYDRVRVLEAEIALKRAELRWHDQQRGDLRSALLALSDSRLSAVAVEEARIDAAEAAADLAEAVADGLPAREIESLTLEAELAAIELERERLEHRSAEEALAELRPTSTAAPPSAPPSPAKRAWLVAPPSPQLGFPDGAAAPTAQRDILALQLALAEHELTLAPFDVLRQVELYGDYQSSGVEAGARFALERGVPTTEATLGWQLGADESALTFGVGATLRLSDTSSATTTVAHREVSEARAALAEFTEEWPARELLQRTLAELAFREFVLETLALDMAEAELAELEVAVSEPAVRETEAARTAVRRARGITERAWQRYVRELTDYLDVIDVVIETRSR